MKDKELKELIEGGKTERARVNALYRQIKDISRAFNRRVLQFFVDEGYEFYAYIPQSLSLIHI